MASGDSTDKQGRSWFGLSPSGLISGVTNTVKNTVSTVAHSIGIAKQEEEVMDPSSTMADTQGDDQVNRHRSRAVQVCQTRVPVCQTRSLDSKELLDDCIKETEIEKLSGILKKRDQQILALREETDVIQRRNLALESNKKELESKVQSLEKQVAQMSKLRHSRGGKDEDQGNAAKLQEHLKEQSRVIMGLRKDQEQRDVEASEDKGRIHELEDEILRLQEDFQSARESMEQLKQQNKKLLSGRYNPQAEPAGSDVEFCSNARCQAMQHQIYALQEETEEKTRSITSLEKTVAHFQQEKNEAMEQVALAKVEAEIFKSDFEEERRDRTRAQGQLADFKDKKNYATIYQEQETKLKQERDQVIQERNSLKRELSRAKAELSKQKDKTVMKEVLEMHIADTEKISRDRDLYRQLARKVKPLEDEVLSSKKVISDLRSSIEVMVENDKVKQKELQKAVEQIKQGNSVEVSLTTALDKAKRSLSDTKLEIQELKKAKRSLDNQIKKLEKNIKKSGHQHLDVDESSFEHLYDQELQTNLELKNHNQFLEGKIEDMTMEIEEYKKLMHKITIYKAVPEAPEEVTAQSAPRKNKTGSESSKKTRHDQFSSKPPQRQVMERDVEEKTSSSLASRSKLNQQQHSQQNSGYNRELGQSNLDKTRKQVIQSQNSPPIPPRQPCGPSSQIQGTNSSEKSRDGRDHEHLHQARQGADNFHSFGDFDEQRHALPAGNRGSEPAVGPDSRSTWPVAKNELPLRAGANSVLADNLVNQGNPPSSSGYEGKSSINAVSDHGSHDNGNHSGLADKTGKDQYCYESNSSGAVPLRAGAGRGHLARARNYNEDGQPIRAGAKGSHSNHSFTDDRNRVPFRAGQENKHSVRSEMDNQHVLTGGSNYPSQVGYDDGYQDQLPHGRYPPQGSSGGDYLSRRGNHGNYSTPAESDMDVLHNRRERKRNVEPGDPDCLHPASIQSGFMQQEQEQNFESQNRGKSTDSSQVQNYSRENISERRGSSSEISGETDHTGFERGGVRDREQMYGVNQEGATESNQQQHRSREYLARQRGSGSSNFETTRNEKHQNYGPNSPLLRCEASHHAQSQSRGEHYRNEEQRKPSHPQSMKEDCIEPHRQQVQASAMASASRSHEYPAASVGQGLHKDHRSGEPDLPHQAKFSEGQTVTAKRVASQNPGRAEYYSEEHNKDKHQATDRVGLPDTGKPHSLPQKHYDNDVKDERLISKDLSAVDTVTPDKNEQKDKAPTTENNPEAEDSKSAQSDASSDTDDKSLHKDIDDDIKVMAQEIDKQVNRDPSTITTIQRKPMDPNLICPICGKQFRIGEIQKFRAHVDNCV